MALPSKGGMSLAWAAFVCGVSAFPLWLLSYAWLPLRLMGRSDSELVWRVVVGSELGAMLLGLSSIGVGWVARRRAARGSGKARLAVRAVACGVIVWLLIVGFNLLGLIGFS